MNWRFTWLLLLAAATLWAERVPGRYVVVLADDSVVEHMGRTPVKGGLRGAAASEYRSQLRGAQSRMRSRLEQRSARVLDSVDTVANAMLVSIPDEQASQLQSLSGVKRVLPVRTKHMIMDRAIALQRVIDAWNRVGEDRAGAGVKIAIIDSGVDSTHAGLRDPSLQPPEGFPRAGSASDLQYTSGKVIVSRSYVNLLPRRDPDLSGRDRVSHGTALAMVAAGVRTAAPLGTIEGIAPKAFIGNYKVFGTPGVNNNSTDDAILKAMDDAVADGMDIINLSLGGDLAPRLEDDISVLAVERATRAGVIVVVAAGNNGPDLNTMSSPGTAPSAITVGAVTSDRTFAAGVEVEGLGSYVGILTDGAAPQTPVQGPIADVQSISGDALACSALPPGSLEGKIALIQRGICTFESKLLTAQLAGAIGAIVFAGADAPRPFAMGVGSARLPALMIANADGLAIQRHLAAQSIAATLRFTRHAVPVPPSEITDFSAAGPNVDLSIKPDLVAVGADVYTATQSLDPSGDMFSSNGFIVVDGTSFSAPMVAGAAALLKSAHPGLTVSQYRALLIQSARPLSAADGSPLPLQQTGAGELDVEAALEAEAIASPVSLGFGAGGSDVDLRRNLTITNTGADHSLFLIGAETRAGSAAPSFDRNTIELAPGASLDLPVSLYGNGLTPGPQEGYVTITNVSTGVTTRVPYWYAVRSTEPHRITILDQDGSGRRGSLRRDAVLFRVTDISGIPLPDAPLEVTVLSGDGSVIDVSSYDSEVPGLYGLTLQLGPLAGLNVFRIQAGSATAIVTISGQ